MRYSCVKMKREGGDGYHPNQVGLKTRWIGFRAIVFIPVQEIGRHLCTAPAAAHLLLATFHFRLDPRGLASLTSTSHGSSGGCSVGRSGVVGRLFQSVLQRWS